MGYPQVQEALRIGDNIPEVGQSVTVIAINRATGTTVSRTFPSFSLATQWLGGDFNASNLEIVKVG